MVKSFQVGTLALCLRFSAMLQINENVKRVVCFSLTIARHDQFMHEGW